MKRRNNREAESREAATELKRIRGMSWVSAKEMRALDLAISLLEARAFDAGADEE